MNLFVKFIFISVFATTLTARADHEKSHPCKKIKAACEAAGFKKGGHKEGKGIMMDCMKPISEGKTVAGVTVDAADVEACKAKRAEHHK